MDLFKYIELSKNKTFLEEPFNDIDNVILSQIAYAPLDGIVNGFNGNKISIAESSDILLKKWLNKEISLTSKLYKDTIFLIKKIGKTIRYKDLLLYNYKKIIDDDKQFGAVTIKLPNNAIYVSFEGTNTAITGWKEDAYMTYKFPVPAQTLAIDYLKRTVSLFDGKIIVGGHSKGGNLAIVASMYSPFYIKRRIKKIYNNDGPGFLNEVFISDEYKSISKKIIKIVPNESVIGMLLNQEKNIIVVKSKKRKLYQHNPLTWLCTKNGFVETELSDYSKKVSIKMNKWMHKFNTNEKKNCVLDFFGILEEEKIQDTKQFSNAKKIANIIFRITRMETKSKSGIKDAIKIVI